MAAQLVQMVTVVDRSGKAVKSNKHMLNVWKEAKAAYKARKAQLRQHSTGNVPTRASVHTLTDIDEGESQTSSTITPRHGANRRLSYDDRAHGHDDRRSSASGSPSVSRRGSVEIQRSQTQLVPAPAINRSRTAPSSPTIDMDMAYGDLPPDLLPPGVRGQSNEQQLNNLTQHANRLLEEADCLRYSATKTISVLQKNPEALAAVALTLAEISSLTRKMGLGSLLSVRAGAPSVFALLASSEFLIAGGVAVGLTIVALGGYKIIKQMRAKRSNENLTAMKLASHAGGRPGINRSATNGPMDQMVDLSRIDTWRHGLADEQARSVGTSVDGELITPHAAAMSRLAIEDGGQRRRHSADVSQHGSSRDARDGRRKSHSGSSSSSSTTTTTTSSSHHGHHHHHRRHRTAGSESSAASSAGSTSTHRSGHSKSGSRSGPRPKPKQKPSFLRSVLNEL